MQSNPGKVFARLELFSDFTAWMTYALAFFPVTYGALLFANGEQGWNLLLDDSAALYEVALAVPFAPESWAAVAFISGIGIIWAQSFKRWRALALYCTFLTVWLLFFALSFIGSWMLHHYNPASLIPCVAHTALALLATGRARMAWAWHTLKD